MLSRMKMFGHSVAGVVSFLFDRSAGRPAGFYERCDAKFGACAVDFEVVDVTLSGRTHVLGHGAGRVKPEERIRNTQYDSREFGGQLPDGQSVKGRGAECPPQAGRDDEGWPGK